MISIFYLFIITQINNHITQYNFLFNFIPNLILILYYRTKTSSPTLHSDMLFEIFSRTSLQTIGWCRLVSKDLNLITYNSSFVQVFCQRTKIISGFFTQALSFSMIKSQFVSITDFATEDSIVFLKFLSTPVKTQHATKQNILLCVNEDNTRRYQIPEYYVYKPITKS
jgi:hypothetical protein